MCRKDRTKVATLNSADRFQPNESKDPIDDINRAAYANAEGNDRYDDLDFLFETEAAIFKEITPVIKDKKLLEIGIGGGNIRKLARTQ